MQYTVVKIKMSELGDQRDLLVYELGDEGKYDSFEETQEGLNAYVPTAQFDRQWLEERLAKVEGEVSYEAEALEDKDWNEEWEKGHKAVLVDGFCWVRAPFHEHRTDVQYEVEIEPKMAFGTAHHATTYLMLTLLRDVELQGRRVMDMGCGTGVLAILAKKRGAGYVEAVDIDEWAVANAKESVERNGCGDIECRLGDAHLLEGRAERFDVVVANINRNILMGDMGRYVEGLAEGGTLLLSGFYTTDVATMEGCLQQHGLRLVEVREREGWAAIRAQR